MELRLDREDWGWGGCRQQICAHVHGQPCNEDARGPSAVGRHKPNPIGLHDMFGNVSELVEDCYNLEWDKANAPMDGSPWIEESLSDFAQRLAAGRPYNTDDRRNVPESKHLGGCHHYLTKGNGWLFVWWNSTERDTTGLSYFSSPRGDFGSNVLRVDRNNTTGFRVVRELAP